MPTTAYIGLGSNQGDRASNLRKALELLAAAGRVTRVSSWYCTEPVGYEAQEDFLNAVAEIETEQSPEELLARCREIEDQLGRVRGVRWGPRTIDLDILLYGSAVMESAHLTIPHLLLAERRFVLVPLCEIAPAVVHPILKKTIRQLLRELRDEHKVVKCGTS